MKQQYFDKSEQYLLNQMSTEEKFKFEFELKVNKELEQEFELAKAILGSAALNAKKNINVELNEIHERHFGDQNHKKKNKRLKIWKIARNIAAILILGFLFKIIMTPKVLSSGEILATYYSPPELAITYRGSNETQIVQTLSQLYENRNYEAFLSQTSQQDSLIDAKPILKLASAIAYLETDAPSLARDLLKELVANPLYSDQAKWYLAFSYLNEDNISKARQIFEEISKKTGQFQNNAKELLKSL